MKADTPSETALRIAGNRIAAARDPVLRRVLADPEEPYSEWFVRAHSARARLLLRGWKWGPTRNLIYRMSDAVLPGGALHILIRKRYVEDQARVALQEGVQQVVVFGAGLDPLPLRLLKAFPEVRVYEIDHPATQGVKRQALQERSALPERLALLPVDFSRESAEEKLRAAPEFRPDACSLYLAEGVLMYLEQADVDALFACVRRNSAPGSRFIFTMVDQSRLGDPGSPVAAMARMTERLGEPIRSSIERKRLDGFLRKHGFKSRAVADHNSLKSAYLKPLKIDRSLIEGELIVVAQAV